MIKDSKDYVFSLGEYRISVHYRKVRQMRIEADATTAEIRFIAPLGTDPQTIEKNALKKESWIRNHFAKFDRVGQKAKVSYQEGEIHYFEGEPYTLRIVKGNHLMVRITEDKVIELQIMPDTPDWYRETMLEKWYRVRLQIRIASLLRKWQEIMGVELNQCLIKKMKTKWGTCNPKAKRVWINLELAKRSDRALEYILVHELCHLFEFRHNARYYGILEQFLADWKDRNQELLRYPVSRI